MSKLTQQLESYTEKKARETSKILKEFILDLTKDIEKENEKHEELQKIRIKKLKLVDEMIRFFMTYMDTHIDAYTKKKKIELGVEEELFPERMNKHKAKYDDMHENLLSGLTGGIFKYAFGERSESEVDSAYKILLKEFKEIFPLLISEKYDPPTNMNDIILQLSTILMYYANAQHRSEFSLNIDLRIDYAMSHLMILGTAAAHEIERKGVGFDRIFKSTQTIVKKKAEKKQMILEEYYRIKAYERKGMSKHKKATTIQKKIGKIYQDPPSLSTIKRYLEEENLI